MNSKLIRTIFLALAFGFLVLWVLEFRRAGLLESYWLLLLCIVCFLLFQFSRLKAATLAKQAGESEAVSKKNSSASAVGSTPSHSKTGKNRKK
ncbi:hypothetical protein SAMN05216327_10633 [Dyadobacter sp. SG02]|uniref:hypothetical protein n=1 Tax=Dyadobacter sp. SG02 TaxID=1855291 RepID=UPI0008CA8582|nr:hypothetical protein [Dyadobacter sp. SG02]SEJ09414.1 hypothetical protein SAMN05216327_10633 [Dyadobacter sp. SG02]